MPTTAITSATQAVPGGATVTVRMAGSLPIWLDNGTFRHNLGVYLEMQGFDIYTLTTETNTGFPTKDWTGTFTGKFAARTNVSGIIAAAKTAMEGAGSYSPTATLPSYGQPDQPALPDSAFDNVGNSLGQGLSGLFEGIGSAAKTIPQIPILLVGGIVILGALIAFGPSFKGTGKAVAARLPV